MHYFQFHIGDYTSHTAHLSNLEDLAYRRLLDLYYDKETPIPNDIPMVSRRIRMGIEEVETVLKEFFVLDSDGWKNVRANLEINEYHEFLNKQKANGKLGGRPKKTQAFPKPNPKETQTEPKITLTNSQSPSPTTQVKEQPPARKRATLFDAKEIELPNWLPADIWGMWVDDRKSRSKPISKLGAEQQLEKLAKYRADGFSAESVIRHCVANGYQGLFPPPKENHKPGQDDGEWHESVKGVQKKASEIGIGPWVEMEEHWPAYRARVMRAAKGDSGPSLSLNDLMRLAEQRKSA